MSMTVIKEGNEPAIGEAVAWLESLGVPRNLMKTVNVLATVGQPLLIQVALYVPDPKDLETDNAGPGQPDLAYVPEPSPVRRDRCPCGSEYQHAEQGEVEQHNAWLDQAPATRHG